MLCWAANLKNDNTAFIVLATTNAADAHAHAVDNGQTELAMIKHHFLLATLFGAALVVFVVFSAKTEFRRIQSPDGRFYAVVEHRAWLSYLPMSPGSAGDKSGFVTVYSNDGTSFGTAPIPMLQFINDLSWQSDAAEIPLVANWDLLNRTVTVRAR